MARRKRVAGTEPCELERSETVTLKKRAQGSVEALDRRKKEVQDTYLSICVYRHLLRNLSSELRRRELEEKSEAPRVKGPRAAAVLARLWVDDELGRKPSPQKVLGADLGIATGELGKMLKELREPGDGGQSCVEIVNSLVERERLYKITEKGKEELKKWLLAHNAPGRFMQSMVDITPDLERLNSLAGNLRTHLGKILAN